MNTRRLRELVILNGVFSMIVLMALVTPFMTTHLLHIVDSRRAERHEMEEAAGAVQTA